MEKGKEVIPQKASGYEKPTNLRIPHLYCIENFKTTQVFTGQK
jgi:hypothetical protein